MAYSLSRNGVPFQIRTSTYGIRYRYVPPKPRSCEFKLSGKPGSNGKVLLVRCQCQPRGSSPLGEAVTLPAARQLWDEHLAEKHADSPGVTS